MTSLGSRGAIAANLIVGQTDSSSSLQTELSSEAKLKLAEAEQLMQQATKLKSQGQYADAIPLAESALAIRQQILGQEHPLVAISLNNLAYLHERQGNYLEAELLYRQTLPILQRLLGDEHPAVATSLNNLALLYYRQGRYSEAEPLYRQALEMRQRLLGDEHPAVATSLNNLALLYYRQGRYSEAEPLYRQALEMRQRLLGDQHPDVATSLNNLALLYSSQGRYSEAEPLYRQALEMRQRLLGDQHPDVATVLDNLAQLYYSQGRYSEAESLYRQALEMRQRLLGDQHPDVATSLNNLALLYSRQGRYNEAEPLFRQALEMRQRLLGDQHPAIATMLDNLAQLYYSQGRYSEAEPLYRQALEMRQRLLGDQHPDVATSLNNLAQLYYSQGRHSEAESLFRRALEMYQRLLGDQHPAVATSLNDLAYLYRIQGRYSEAEPLFRQALEMYQRLLGDQHPDVATMLDNLALLYKSQGRYSEAEPLFRQALEMRQRLLGDQHPAVATSLNNLAQLYYSQGRYSEAEPLFRQALEMRQRLLGDQHPTVATTLNDLALLYYSRGRYSEAEPLFRQALEMYQRLLGDEHPSVATMLDHLALLYYRQGRYSEAEPLFRQALEMRQRLLGDQHPAVAKTLDNLALLYSSQGRYSEAEPLFRQALEMRQRLLGDEHLDVATNLNNLAGLYWAQGEITRTVELLNQGVNIEEYNLDRTLAIGSERQKQDYMATIAGTTYGTVSLHLQDAPKNPQAAHLALTTLLRRKGRILDAVTDNLQTLRQNLTPENQELLDKLATTRSQLAALLFRGIGDTPPQQYRQQIATLKAEVNELENTLSFRSAEFRTASQPVTIEAVQQLIPGDTALVELVLYKPFNPKAQRGKRWGKPHYAAYILHSQGEPQWVDLGAAEPINQLITEFRTALQNSSPKIKTIARQLDEQLMQPIRPLLGNNRNLLLSPDSQLNLIPFAALVDESDRYLLENYTITYLTSGRDLLKLQLSVPSRSQPLIVANPDYSSSGKTGGRGDAETRIEGDAGTEKTRNRRSNDFTNFQFGPLPGTKQEALAIAPMLPEARLLTESQATENAIKQVQSPSILHIATHGFFLKDIERVAAPDYANPFSSRANIGVEYSSGTSSPPKIANLENPLLRSGLALAGINLRQSGTEDGVLTALETAGLNLSGTKLVVLSACETGVGDIANGEGVYGLRRALVMAGAESQLFSLWKVDDTGTKDLMVKYYQRLLNNEGRSQALRQTQLEMLRNQNYQHPYYWAAFIPSGDWTPMGN
ncbi:MAG: tetratricopeptide repeat protein [Symploca sp. SIO2G7]|nr:tetratricopeptide repeat protein [Symploca sp. SIO2G7]